MYLNKLYSVELYAKYAVLPSKKKQQKGFTLIELLVVVLIIGILAAIALPQYQRAVEKTKALKAISLMASLEKSIEWQLLLNDGFTNIDLLENSAALDIEIPAGLSSPDFEYHAICAANGGCYKEEAPCCWWWAYRRNTTENNYYALIGERAGSNTAWSHSVDWQTNYKFIGQWLIGKEGWQRAASFL